MATITFDTLKFARRLQAAGFSKDQAEALAEAQLDATKEAAGDVATKADLSELRSLIKADIAESKADILKWMFGALVAQVGFIVAILKLL